MQTERGGRFTLRLLSAASDEVRYEAELSAAGSEYRGTVVIRGSDGQVAFDPPAAPDWLEARARAVLRSEWRARRSDSPAPWPRRLTRWRREQD